MIIEWRAQRSVQVIGLLVLSAMFAIPGILLIAEQSSRQNNDVHDEAMNISVALGPTLLIFGLVLFIGAIILFVYSEMKRQELAPAAAPSANGTRPPSTVYTIDITRDRHISRSSHVNTNNTTSSSGGGDDMYAPRYDDDQVVFEPHTSVLEILEDRQQEVQPGDQPARPQGDDGDGMGTGTGVPSGAAYGGLTDSEMQPVRGPVSSGDLSEGNGSYMYGYLE